jgi:hypothetical protein
LPQRPGAGFLQVFDDELKIAARFVQADTAARQHLLAVARAVAEQQGAVLEQRAANLRPASLSEK